jgi:hypothetical protein
MTPRSMRYRLEIQGDAEETLECRVYGVGAANILFLPIPNKIKRQLAAPAHL